MSYSVVDFDDLYQQTSKDQETYPYKVVPKETAKYDPTTLLKYGEGNVDHQMNVQWPEKITGYRALGPAVCSKQQGFVECDFDKDVLYIRDDPKYSKKIQSMNTHYNGWDKGGWFYNAAISSDPNYLVLSDSQSYEQVPTMKAALEMGTAKKDFVSLKSGNMRKIWGNHGGKSGDWGIYRNNEDYNLFRVVAHDNRDNETSDSIPVIVSAKKAIDCCKGSETTNCGGFDPAKTNGKTKCDLLMNDYCSYIKKNKGTCEDGTCTDDDISLCGCIHATIDNPLCFDKYCNKDASYKTSSQSEGSDCSRCNIISLEREMNKGRFDDSKITPMCRRSLPKKTTVSPIRQSNPPTKQDETNQEDQPEPTVNLLDPSTPAPVTNTKINWKYIYILIGVIVLIIILAVGAYFMFRSSDDPSDYTEE